LVALDRITYIANDGLSDSEPAMISIYVRNVNDLPYAQWGIALMFMPIAV
jgi:hypothetical protein